MENEGERTLLEAMDSLEVAFSHQSVSWECLNFKHLMSKIHYALITKKEKNKLTEKVLSLVAKDIIDYFNSIGVKISTLSELFSFNYQDRVWTLKFHMEVLSMDFISVNLI